LSLGVAVPAVGVQPPGVTTDSYPALSSANHMLTPRTGVALVTPSSVGAVKAITPKVAWGGSRGTILKAGRTKDITLHRPKGVAADVRTFTLFIHISEAKKAGTLRLGPVGEVSAPVIAFDRNESETTTISAVSEGMRLRIRSSTTIRIQIAILGYASGSGEAKLGPGGYRAVKPAVLVDSAKGVGGPLPTKGVYLQGKGTGRFGVPAEGVRAVWLSVQTLGATDGVAGGRRTDGQTETAADVSVKKGKWTTSLVLAPVDESGGFEWTMREGRLKAARISLVGWIADTGPMDSVATTPGGIVALKAKRLTPQRNSVASAPAQLMTAQVVGGSVPTHISTVFLFAWVETPKRGQDVKISTVVLPAAISPDGKVTFSVKKGAKVKFIGVIGYLAADPIAAADPVEPEVTINAVNNGLPVTLSSNGKVRLSGTFMSQGSGTRSVVVSIGDEVLGSARLDTTCTPRRWSLTTTLPPGNPMLTVTLTSHAGTVVKAQVPATVLIV